MITRVLTNNRCRFYDDDVLICSFYIDLVVFKHHILTKINNKFDVLVHSEYTNKWHSISTGLPSKTEPQILYNIYICRYSTITKNNIITFNSDFECISIGNGYDDLINYALNKVRIEKLKTLV